MKMTDTPADLLPIGASLTVARLQLSLESLESGIRFAASIDGGEKQVGWRPYRSSRTWQSSSPKAGLPSGERSHLSPSKSAMSIRHHPMAAVLPLCARRTRSLHQTDG